MTNATFTSTATPNNSLVDRSTTTPANAISSTEETTAIEQMLPIRMVSKVVRGFGRGSSDLGIPTANLDRQALRMAGVESKDSSISIKKDASLCFEDLPCGIYWGFCRIGNADEPTEGTLGVVYTAAISIGYNPTYGNGTYQ
jgi:riboflavin kinase